MALQRALNDSGAYPPLSVDGILGAKTIKAVNDWQRAAGLPIILLYYVDDQTLSTLGIIPGTGGAQSPFPGSGGSGGSNQSAGGSTYDAAQQVGAAGAQAAMNTYAQGQPNPNDLVKA